MPLSALTAADAAKLQTLLVRKFELQRALDAINRELDAIEAGSPVAKPTVARARRGRKAVASAPKAAAPKAAQAAPAKSSGGRTPHGAVKNAIIAILKESGEKGISIKDIAKKTGFKAANIGTWIYTSGANNKNVKRAGHGTYRWQE